MYHWVSFLTETRSAPIFAVPATCALGCTGGLEEKKEYNTTKIRPYRELSPGAGAWFLVYFCNSMV
jgi:hypothetical protein